MILLDVAVRFAVAMLSIGDSCSVPQVVSCAYVVEQIKIGIGGPICPVKLYDESWKAGHAAYGFRRL